VPAGLTTLFAAALWTATPPGAAGVPNATATAPGDTQSPAPPGAAPEECPAAAQLAAALNALMPGLAPASPPSMPLALASGGKLGVTTSPEGDVRVDLVDPQGDVVLHRVLPAPPRGHAPDCAAIGDTIALIVDRYLHDVGYEAPPLPPPAPKPAAPAPAAEPPTSAVVAAPPPRAAAPRALWRLGVAGGARLGDAGGFDGDGDLALGLEPSPSGVHSGFRLSAGYAPPAEASWTDRTATLRRIPLRLGLFVAVPLGPGQLEPGLGGGADLYISSVSGAGGSNGVHPAPMGDLSLGYSLALAGPMYVRVLSRIALAVPYRFEALEVPQVWGTPRVYGEAGVELGLSFR
jgi:hypothetical protein